jgi:hypothetical protein
MSYPKMETVGKPILQARDAVKNKLSLCSVRGFPNGLHFEERISKRLEELCRLPQPSPAFFHHPLSLSVGTRFIASVIYQMMFQENIV